MNPMLRYLQRFGRWVRDWAWDTIGACVVIIAVAGGFIWGMFALIGSVPDWQAEKSAVARASQMVQGDVKDTGRPVTSAEQLSSIIGDPSVTVMVRNGSWSVAKGHYCYSSTADKVWAIYNDTDCFPYAKPVD